MTERRVELEAILSEIKRRWTQRLMLRAWTLGAAASATIIAVGFIAAFFVASEGLPLVFTAAVVTTLSAFVMARALWPLHRRPTDRQLARFIEEHEPALDDVVVTAVDYQSRPDSSAAMREVLAADAAAALSALDLDRIVSSDSIRQAALKAAAASAALGLTAALFGPAFSRATNVAAAYLFPTRLSVQVTPGSTKITAGQPLTITARVGQLGSELVPTLTVTGKDESRSVRMTPGKEPGTFAVSIESVTASFGYHVSAAGARSEDYTITVVRPPHVQRIDLRYDFPKGLGLEPRLDEDSGDIYGPAGTKVTVSITTDKPIASAALALGDGTRVPLAAQGATLETTLTIDDDGSYRVALADHDGLENPGDTEYFIRTLDDRPPDVRILRPASDKQVTPLEEVLIEARADDDYGIESFELVFQTPAGKQRTVPLRGKKGALTTSALHTIFMEDLGVQPGDFVTYYARARDVNRGRRSTEARSDIFFLEVKPFEEEFVSAQSQAMGQGGMQGDRSIEALIESQKEIIVATWKLDARARRARDQASQQDIKAVGKAQSELRSRAEQMGAQAARALADPRRRRSLQGATPNQDPMGRAVEAMGRAVTELDAVRTGPALPHEMEALNQLLKAAAENRRRQVTRGQQASGGGGANRSEADLSTLFDQELRKRQQTNYETPNSTEERQENKPDDLLERIRELARRQDALNRQQRELGRNREQIEEEELKRQLERLTREQNELRQQAEQLASRMQQRQQQSQQDGQQSQQSGQQSQQSGQQSQNGQSAGSNSQDGRRMREISEAMRDAATGLRRQDSQQAEESGARASERLRELERQVQSARPDDRRRALGDLQLETRQLADSQRRVATETGHTAQGQPGDDARRRLAGEQDRLAQRVDRLEEQVKRLSSNGAGQSEEKRATEEAARELDRQKLAERMRQSAESLRQGSGANEQAAAARDRSRDAARQGQEMAQALDRIADRLGAASGTDDANGRRLSDQLNRTQELRDKVDGLNRSIEELQREAQRQQASQQGQNAQGQPQGNQAQGNQAQSTQAQSNQGQSQAQSQGSPSTAEGREPASGQQSGSTGGQGGRLQQLQQEVNERMRDAERLAGELRRENPAMRGADGTENWWRSFSAPGTEAFKQDFARWESLKSNLLVALEDVDSKVSDELRARANKERLNAGGHDAVSEAYRELVEKYYRLLAAPRKPQ